MTMNYASLLAAFPDMFPMCQPQSETLQGVELSALRILHLLQNTAFSRDFMLELNREIKGKDSDSLVEIYRFVFTELREGYASGQLTIFDKETAGNLDILANIISESDEMKEIFLGNRQKGMAWIPGPNGMNLEKGIGSCEGNMLESQSVLGPFFSVSFLPNSIGLRRDERFKRTADKTESELKGCKTQQQFDK